MDRNIVNHVNDIGSKPYILHSIFWFAFLLFFTITEPWENGIIYNLSNSLIITIFYMAIAYINLYILIPRFLNQKNFLLYSALLMVVAILLTPIRSLVIYLKVQETMSNNFQTTFLALFLFGGVTTLFKIVSDWLKHQRVQKELETQTMQNELKFLRSQINPHFLFNTLNNLYALTLKKSDKAPEIVIKLSEMMRYMLYECNEKQVLLEKEINYLRNYLDLEQLRQGENVKINFAILGNINGQTVAPMIFIPFIENSFKHGLNKHLKEGFVDIRIKVLEKHLRLEIENSKPEAVPTEFGGKKSGGIGLVNVKRRLNLLYPDQYKLEIKNNPDVYRVELDLEIN